jgi:pectate lyase
MKLIASLVLLFSTPALGALPAFPGAEGSGALAVGGRGGVVCKVTNLNDSGPGSLRDCIQKTGPRTVVFEVSGTIWLESVLEIRNPYITIAGQTAPGGGIQISGKNIRQSEAASTNIFWVATDEVIMRYLRLRNGVNDPPNPGGPNAITVSGNRKNLIFDHLSMLWAHDETWSASGANGITLQNSILAEVLAGHSTNSLIGNAAENLDFHNNLFANTSHRNPLSRAKRQRFVNNIVYNWSLYASQSGGAVQHDYINNLYKLGPISKSSRSTSEIQVYMYDPDTCPIDRIDQGSASIYASGNAGPYYGANNNQDMVKWVTCENGRPMETLPSRFRRNSPLPGVGIPITTRPVDELEAHVLPLVGASRRLDCGGLWVFNRDDADRRIIEEYHSNKGFIPNTETDVGGFPRIEGGTVCKDSSGDGIPDAWLLERGFPVNQAIGPQISDQGYTFLELYLNGPSAIRPDAPSAIMVQ